MKLGQFYFGENYVWLQKTSLTLYIWDYVRTYQSTFFVQDHYFLKKKVEYYFGEEMERNVKNRMYSASNVINLFLEPIGIILTFE